MPGKVKVRIIAGRNLPVMDRSSDTTDAYVEIKLGNTTYKTDVCRKSLNPHWNSEWYRFEVDDSELQDEPLQIRLMDHDTYSANDAIGKVYLNLNPLLIPTVSIPSKYSYTVDSNSDQPSSSIMSGWIPVYDTMHGIRGEVSVTVKVELFSDFNKFRQSSCGVQFFCSPIIPHGYHAQIIHGFIEELVVNDDPEYQWIDKIRTPRASNEARQTLFFKLSGELQRKIGVKALDLGGNAVIGYNQCYDLEGESGIVARGIGTVVTLIKHHEIQQQIDLGIAEEKALSYLKFLAFDNGLKLDNNNLFECFALPSSSKPSTSSFVPPIQLDNRALFLRQSSQPLIEHKFHGSHLKSSVSTRSLTEEIKDQIFLRQLLSPAISAESITRKMKHLRASSQNLLSKKMIALKEKLSDANMHENLNCDPKKGESAIRSSLIDLRELRKKKKSKLKNSKNDMAELLVRSIIHAHTSLDCIYECHDTNLPSTSAPISKLNEDLGEGTSHQNKEDCGPVGGFINKTISEPYLLSPSIEIVPLSNASSFSDLSSSDEDISDGLSTKEDDKLEDFDTVSFIVKNVEQLEEKNDYYINYLDISNESMEDYVSNNENTESIEDFKRNDSTSSNINNNIIETSENNAEEISNSFLLTNKDKMKELLHSHILYQSDNIISKTVPATVTFKQNDMFSFSTIEPRIELDKHVCNDNYNPTIIKNRGMLSKELSRSCNEMVLPSQTKNLTKTAKNIIDKVNFITHHKTKKSSTKSNLNLDLTETTMQTITTHQVPVPKTKEEIPVKEDDLQGTSSSYTKNLINTAKYVIDKVHHIKPSIKIKLHRDRSLSNPDLSLVKTAIHTMLFENINLMTSHRKSTEDKNIPSTAPVLNQNKEGFSFAPAKFDEFTHGALFTSNNNRGKLHKDFSRSCEHIFAVNHKTEKSSTKSNLNSDLTETAMQTITTHQVPVPKTKEKIPVKEDDLQGTSSSYTKNLINTAKHVIDKVHHIKPSKEIKLHRDRSLSNPDLSLVKTAMHTMLFENINLMTSHRKSTENKNIPSTAPVLNQNKEGFSFAPEKFDEFTHSALFTSNNNRGKLHRDFSRSCEHISAVNLSSTESTTLTMNKRPKLQRTVTLYNSNPDFAKMKTIPEIVTKKTVQKLTRNISKSLENIHSNIVNILVNTSYSHPNLNINKPSTMIAENNIATRPKISSKNIVPFQVASVQATTKSPKFISTQHNHKSFVETAKHLFDKVHIIKSHSSSKKPKLQENYLSNSDSNASLAKIAVHPMFFENINIMTSHRMATESRVENKKSCATAPILTNENKIFLFSETINEDLPFEKKIKNLAHSAIFHDNYKTITVKDLTKKEISKSYDDISFSKGIIPTTKHLIDKVSSSQRDKTFPYSNPDVSLVNTAMQTMLVEKINIMTPEPPPIARAKDLFHTKAISFSDSDLRPHHSYKHSLQNLKNKVHMLHHKKKVKSHPDLLSHHHHHHSLFNNLLHSNFFEKLHIFTSKSHDATKDNLYSNITSFSDPNLQQNDYKLKSGSDADITLKKEKSLSTESVESGIKLHTETELITDSTNPFSLDESSNIIISTDTFSDITVDNVLDQEEESHDNTNFATKEQIKSAKEMKQVKKVNVIPSKSNLIAVDKITKNSFFSNIKKKYKSFKLKPSLTKLMSHPNEMSKSNYPGFIKSAMNTILMDKINNMKGFLISDTEEMTKNNNQSYTPSNTNPDAVPLAMITKSNIPATISANQPNNVNPELDEGYNSFVNNNSKSTAEAADDANCNTNAEHASCLYPLDRRIVESPVPEREPSIKHSHQRTESTGCKMSQSPARLNAIPCIHRRSSDSDLSITPKGINRKRNSLTGSDRSGSAIPGYHHIRSTLLRSTVDNFDMMEFPFLTMAKYPSGFILQLGGAVSARSVKLLERITNIEDPETRDTWWSELRTEIRTHARALNCNIVLGYIESTSICDEVCVLSASGTAAVIPLYNGELSDGISGLPNLLKTHLPNKDLMTSSLDRTDFEKEKTIKYAEPMSASANIKIPQVSESPEQEVTIEFSGSSNSQVPPTSCRICHIPYSESNMSFRVNMLYCSLCKMAKVPDILLATIEMPEGLPTTGRGCFLQSYVCRPKRDLKGELNAKEISESLPFLEYELHRLLVNKMKVKAMNTIFGLKVRITIGERMLVGVATGTAVFLLPLPPPPLPKLVSGNTTSEDKKISEMQKLLVETVKKNKEIYELKDQEYVQPIRTSSDTEESDEEKPSLDLSAGNKDSCILEVDDSEDIEVINLLIEPRPPDGFHVVNTENVPGLEELEIVKNLQMFTQVWRAKIPINQSASHFGKHFQKLLQSVYFKLRRMIPCALCDLQFRVDLPEQDEIQLTLLGMALGLGDPMKLTKFKRKNITHLSTKENKKSDDEMIFSLEDDFIPENSVSVISSSGLLNTHVPKLRQKSPQRLRVNPKQRHTPIKERYGVDITPLSYVPGGKIERYLGYLNFFFIRETTSMREGGGLSGFVHSFITEVLAIVRAHVTALGGNAMVSYFMTECILCHNAHKNQGQCLINVGGDVVFVSYFSEDP